IAVPVTVNVRRTLPVFCRLGVAPLGARMQTGWNAKSFRSTVWVGPLGVHATGVFEREHARLATQSITRTKRDRRVRIGPRAYREPRSRGTSITLSDMSS